MTRKIKGKTPLKRKIKGLEREKSSSSDELDSDSEEDSLSEDSDIGNGSSPESSKAEGRNVQG